MTSRLHSSCSREMRAQAASKAADATAARHLPCRRDRDVGAVRLSRIRVLSEETRAARAGK